MQANLTIDQRKALLMGLGCEERYADLGADMGPCFGICDSEGNPIGDCCSTEQAAYESIPLDMNFCFDVVIPWMRERKSDYELTYSDGVHYALFEGGPVHYKGHADNPATAICLAALQFMETEK